MSKERPEEHHHRIAEEIRSLAAITESLDLLIEKIEPSPKNEGEGEEKPERGYPHLRSFLENTPDEIAKIRDSCLVKIQDVNKLLFC